jgi:Zn-dependent peptidase ImmA (M78 family)
MSRDVARFAMQALDRGWDGVLPVNPVRVADAFGVACRPVSGFEDGHIARVTVEAGRPVVYYNKDESFLRKRFAVAHALGHVVLGHGPVAEDTVSSFSADHKDPHEAEANQFAMAVLMPGKAVRALTQKIYDVDDLAAACGVSRVAMVRRLVEVVPAV